MKKYSLIIAFIFMLTFSSCAEHEIPIFREATEMTLSYTSGNTVYEGVLSLTEGVGDSRDYSFTFRSPESVEGIKIERRDGISTVFFNNKSATVSCELATALNILSPDEYSVRVTESRGGEYTAFTSTENGEIELFYKKGAENPYKMNVQAGEIFFSFHIK